MSYMFVRHKVADFADWRAVFDLHSEAQRKVGLRVLHVLRNTDDPNEVFLLFEVDDPEQARAFVSAPDVPQAQRDSGVVDDPDIYFLS